MYYSTTCPSSLGVLTLACDSSGGSLTGLWLEGQKYYGSTISGEMREKSGMPVFDRTKDWLDRYFAGERPRVDELALAPAGSVFRREVWRILCEIPYGEVITYGDVAKKAAERLGRAGMSGQAAGGAVAHNPISIIIPCHRVVGANGSLTGYAGGIQNKIKLLTLEGVDISRFFVPKKGTAL